MEAEGDQGHEAAENQATYTLDQGLAAIGFGKFKFGLLIYAGVGSFAEALEMMVLSFIGLAIQPEWRLSSNQVNLVSILTFCGTLVGSYLWGSVSDSYGRKKGFLGAVILALVAGIISTVSPNYTVFVIFRCLSGIGLGGGHVFTSWFLEFLPTPNRGIWMVVFSGFAALGTMFEALLAWWILPRYGWRWLLGASLAPHLVALFFYAYVPESPRHLCAHGEKVKADQVLHDGAVVNKRDLPDGQLIYESERTSSQSARRVPGDQTRSGQVNENAPERTQPESEQRNENTPERTQPESEQMIENAPERTQPETEHRNENAPERTQPETEQMIENAPERTQPETEQRNENAPERTHSESELMNENAPEKSANDPEKTQPESGQMNENAPEKSENDPEKTQPESGQMNEYAPERTIPESRQMNVNASERTQPESGQMNENAPERAQPESALLNENVPGRTQPESGQLNESVPQRTQPESEQTPETPIESQPSILHEPTETRNIQDVGGVRGQREVTDSTRVAVSNIINQDATVGQSTGPSHSLQLKTTTTNAQRKMDALFSWVDWNNVFAMVSVPCQRFFVLWIIVLTLQITVGSPMLQSNSIKLPSFYRTVLITSLAGTTHLTFYVFGILFF